MKSTTLLLRQVKPEHIDTGRVTSQAFFPFPKDENLLSVYDGDLIEASKSHAHFTKVVGGRSAGVWAVTEGETVDAGLSARPDVEGQFPEHAVIDFAQCSSKEARKKAKLLVGMAVQRGCLYNPEEA